MDGWLSYQDCSEMDPWPCPAELYSTCIWVVPNSVKKAGVCAVMSMWLMHIKDHLWTVRFTPNQRVFNSSGVRWTGYDGKMQKKWSVLHEAAPLYASRELRWEEVAPPHKGLTQSKRSEPEKIVNATTTMVRMGYNKEIWNEMKWKCKWCWKMGWARCTREDEKLY